MKRLLRIPCAGFYPVAAIVLALAFPAAAQETIQLVDGRFVTARKLEQDGQKFRLHFQNGDVDVPAALVKETTLLPAPGQTNEKMPPDAAAKLAAGLVRFEGQWIKPEAREKLLQERAAARKKKLADARAHREWRNRYKLETPNFSFEYTIDPDRMANYAALFEAYYKRFLSEWKITRPEKLGRLKVCFYHDAETFHQVSGAGSNVLGYFKFIQPAELDFYYDRFDERLTIDVMFHETNHYLTWLIDPLFLYPPWVNESLAEYYGASTWDPKKKEMQVGALQEARLTIVQTDILAGHWQKLEEMIRIPLGEFNADHYAWGWSFVHYLMSTPKYAAKFKAFYLALGRDTAVKRQPAMVKFKVVDPDEQIRVLKQHLGVKDLDALEKEWHDYVRGLQQTSSRGFAEAGSLCYQLDLPLKAIRFLQTAIEKGDDRASTWNALGLALRRKERFEEAGAALKKALDRDPLNAKYRLDLVGIRQSDDPECRRQVLLAAEIDPDDPEVISRSMYDEELWKVLNG